MKLLASAMEGEELGYSDVTDAVLESALVLGKELKDKQLAAILAFAQGSDTFVALPTGYKKFLIYGLLLLVFDKLRSK